MDLFCKIPEAKVKIGPSAVDRICWVFYSVAMLKEAQIGKAAVLVRRVF